MKRYLLLFTIILASFVRGQVPENVIKTYRLDDKNVYIIHVPKPGEGIITISFPSPVTSLDGDDVVSDPKDAANPFSKFFIAYKPGSYFFSIKSLNIRPSNLNVIWNRKTYVLKLIASDKPDYSVNFIVADAGYRAQGGTVQPSNLLALIDKAKQFPLLQEQYPDVISQIDHCQPHLTMYYPHFNVSVDDVYRFESEDTVVFSITIFNKTTNTLYYKPQDFAVRVGDNVYYQSISDASGILPAAVPLTDDRGRVRTDDKGKTLLQIVPTRAYFAVTGTANGGRNNLSVQNQWNVIVNEIDPLAVATQPPVAAHLTPGLDSKQLP